MKKLIHILGLRIFLIILLFGIGNQLYSQVENGSIDLKEYNLDEEIINLDGQWEYHDGVLYTPEETNNDNSETKYFNVPSLWNNLITKNISGVGSGTYKLKIHSLIPGKIYALNINRIQSSYKIWIDNELLKTVGIVGNSDKESKAGWSSEEIVFKANNQSAEIVLQVSNYHHKKGGIEHSISFGFSSQILNKTRKNLAVSIFLLGVFLIMAAYHLGMFAFRSNDRTNLYFALTLIFSGIFSTTVNEIYIVKLFPGINWELLIKINYISNYLRLLFFILFIYNSFKSELNTNFTKILSGIILFMILLVSVTPAKIFTYTLIVFLGLTAISLIFLILGQIKALKRKRPGTLYSFIGIFILVIAASNDILKEYQIINTVSATTFGIFIFIILHSYLISIQNSNSYNTIKNLTELLVLQGKVKDTLFSAKSYDLAAPVRAVSEVIDADRSLIFIYENNTWFLNNEYLKADNSVKNMKINVFSGKENILYSSRLVNKTISKGKYIFERITDSLVNKSDSEYTKKSNIKSIFTYPLIKEGSIQSLIYIENFESKPRFGKNASKILDSVMPQIAMFMENYDAYGKLNQFNIELEEKINKVSKEIEESSNEIKILSTQIENQNIQIDETRQKLELQNQEISDGNRYAKKILSAYFNKKTDLKNVFPDSFIFNKPKEYLSGDFFWFHPLNKTENLMIVADSTGHGASGGFMSIIGNEIINDVILYQKYNSPKIILNMIQQGFEERVANNNDVGGFDISVIYFNSENNELIFSGANNPMYLAQDNKVVEYKGTPVSIGSSLNGDNLNKKFFVNNRIKVEKGDMVYLFTDGFIKQLGEETNRKFMKANFKDLIHSIHKENSNIQEEKITKTYNNWRGDEIQTDDILIVGIRI